MRIRATVAAVSGALALSALAVPAAQAEERPAAGVDRPVAGVDLRSGADVFGARSGDAPAARSRAARPVERPVIKKVVVNGGKDIVVGTTSKKKFTVSVTASSPSGVADAYAFLWRGYIDETDSGLVPVGKAADCKVSADPTTSTCTLTIVADPRSGVLAENSLAGTWNVAVAVLADTGSDDDAVWDESHSRVRVQRYSKLTVNASPEPVKKGRAITVTGKLTRANWETCAYRGYTRQPVKLQFRKKGAASYTTVKTVESSSTGTLRTTVKASADGYWRYSFAGTSTTPAVASGGDYLDVK
ncbi:calcium-binding protein [Streptomyces sp. NPDC088729]|uniref:calcium-binding protein n=1 Tax=unclassified Streptomyces TaxID=2593676 RepID=UPI000F558CEF|nr:calcium-binding protein [Streptomyces sp. ADI96-02]